MSNAEAIAMIRNQEFGYDEFNTNKDSWELPRYKTVKVNVRGVIRVFQPKEVRLMGELRALGEGIRAKGWEPLLCIASEHGKCLCYHIYCMQGERFGLYRFSSDQSLLPDSFIEFKSRDEGNEDFKMKRLFVRKNRHVIVDMTELMEVG